MNAVDIWKKVSVTQRYIIVLVLLVAIGLFMISQFSGTTYGTLYSGLDTTDVAAIEKQLTFMGVNYQLTSQGTEIDINEADVPTVRMKLAELGLPHGGNPGFSLFDTSNGIGSTQFDDNVKYTDALIQEIETDLEQGVQGVNNAIVEMPLANNNTDTFGMAPAAPQKATVIVSLDPGVQLSGTQVAGIQNFVSSSVSGLTPADVTVLDQTGNILSANTGSNVDGSLSTAAYNKELAITTETENHIKGQIVGALGQIYGYNNVNVIVRANINFDQISQNITQYAPSGTLVSEQNNTNNSTSNNVQVNPQAGSASNGSVPGYSATTTGNGTQSQDNQSDVIQNWDVGKTVESIIQNPQLTNLNVVVWIDQPLSPAQIQQLQSAVSLAAGITNNGQVQVISTTFKKPTTTEPALVTPVTPTNWYSGKNGLTLIWIVIGGVLFFVTVLLLFNKRGGNRMIVRNEESLPFPGSPVTETEEEYMQSNNRLEQMQAQQEETQHQKNLREKAAENINKDPRRAAEYIRKMINEE